jgi:hypothetical protein
MRTVTYDAAACAQAKHTNSKLFTDSICVCLTQSAQRSKARKLRHIMQLEDEVASLQRITQQQAQRLGALQQENGLLSELSLLSILLPARA